MAVVNRKVDHDIISQLDAATNHTGAYVPASLAMVAKAKTILGVNYVPTNELRASIHPRRRCRRARNG